MFFFQNWEFGGFCEGKWGWIIKKNRTYLHRQMRREMSLKKTYIITKISQLSKRSAV